MIRNLEQQLQSNRVKRDREFIRISANEARDLIALLEAVNHEINWGDDRPRLIAAFNCLTRTRPTAPRLAVD